MRNHRHDVKTGLQQHGHLVPGLIHLAAVDAFDVEHVENHVAPVDGHLLGGNAQHGDASAVRHVGDHFAEGGRVARHFQTYVEALAHAECFLGARDRVVFNVERQVDFHFACEIQSIIVNVGDHHVACTGVADHGGGHDADGAGTGNQDVFAQYIERERSMHGIAEGIEDGSRIAVHSWI